MSPYITANRWKNALARLLRPYPPEIVGIVYQIRPILAGR